MSREVVMHYFRHREAEVELVALVDKGGVTQSYEVRARGETFKFGIYDNALARFSGECRRASTAVLRAKKV